MAKILHEIRDPVHTFIRLDDDERKIIDSRPVQRLRQIHQLAMSYLVYPGATHKRFEHSLGVMELAGHVFDVITDPENIHESVRPLLPEVRNEAHRTYWRRTLRMAALCHDLGHLPFSHAAEHALLPDGWDHERISKELVLGSEMADLWLKMTPPLRAVDVARLAVGPKYFRENPFSDWEAILYEIIGGSAFGVDRMDYLLRDSLHAGVAYGRFDHSRLIDTLRILPQDSEKDGSIEPQLGVESGGLHSAEALLLARYFMFRQVYLHPVRRIYDIHLKDFLTAWLSGGKFSTSIDDHLNMTDTEVIAAISLASRDGGALGHEPARRIIDRDHFRVLWEYNPADISRNPQAGVVIYAAAEKVFGPEAVRADHYTQSGSAFQFPVLLSDHSIVSSQTLSGLLSNFPIISIDYVFVRHDLIEQAKRWLRENRERILSTLPSEEDDSYDPLSAAGDNTEPVGENEKA